ncbi:site-specific integrase [Bacillus haynesii]|nr:site-specific integrase [Bacillus haynesii]MCY9401363.1 site-specific integrase [Bacillus haynesii]
MYQQRIIDCSEQYSQNYLDGIHACGRMIFRQAVELGLMKVNSTENFKLPKKQQTVEKRITKTLYNPSNNYEKYQLLTPKTKGSVRTIRINDKLVNMLKKAGIEKNITPHSFLHTHTSLLLEAGVGIKEIQQRLGHTDINTPMDIYAHMTANMEEKASQKFDKLMENL